MAPLECSIKNTVNLCGNDDDNFFFSNRLMIYGECYLCLTRFVFTHYW